jgi:SAM-dependent methyltransferase
MNLVHRRLCSSARWKHTLATQIVPWALEGLKLGADVLEVGPGYGMTTDLLRSRVKDLTCVEIDRALAKRLRCRAEGENVRLLCESGTAMSLANASFDGAVCFTMLHHVPSAEMQDQLLVEVARVLRTGGVFAGTDSCYSRVFGLLHLFDTMVVVDPSTFPSRLTAIGFEEIEVEVRDSRFRFRARKR